MIPKMMRALQLESFDGPEGLHLREVPTPPHGLGKSWSKSAVRRSTRLI